MVRLFVGIRIENQSQLMQLSTELRDRLKESAINWVDPESFHITLKFLGDVESYYINSINTLLFHVCSKYKPFQLQYNQLGFFGSIVQPKVIWFDFMHSNELNNLQKSVERALGDLGFEIEDKAFKSHVTLGRVKKLKNENDFSRLIESKPIISGTLEVRRFQLIESQLKSSGPVYTTIAEFCF